MNKKIVKKVVLTVLAAYSFTLLLFCGSAKAINASSLPSLSKLPSAESFLMQLLNTTALEVINVANRFTFFDVAKDDVKFMSSDGSFMDNAKYCIRSENNTQIKFIIHGWLSSAKADFVTQIIHNYKKLNENYKVIAVDWSSHSTKIYLHSSSAVKSVGDIVGDFVLDLICENYSLLDQVHIIGHSLGAHIAGFAGKRIEAISGHKIGRITGLDPAGPLFEIPIKQNESSRLNKLDGKFVDVIHTNIGFFGFKASIGSADYFVENGGPIQPGCLNILVYEIFTCSHGKAHQYFANSIDETNIYPAIPYIQFLKCFKVFCEPDGKYLMGESASSKASGNYYVKLNSSFPQLRIALPFFRNA